MAEHGLADSGAVPAGHWGWAVGGQRLQRGELIAG